MSFVVTLTGSPSATSKTAALAALIGGRLAVQGVDVGTINVRDLDPAHLLHARMNEPDIAAAVAQVAAADALVVATPIYKAAYSGILKAFLDLLPQHALTDKIVLPVATGGTMSHMLALDYSLRPVLAGMGALHILASVFLLDTQFTRVDGAASTLDEAADERVTRAVGHLVRVLHAVQAEPDKRT